MSPGRGRRERWARASAPRTADPRAIGEPVLEIGEDPSDDLPRCRPRLVGEQMVQLDEQGDEVDVGFDGLEQLGFEEELAQIEPLDRVPLHHLNHRLREVGADVTQPARHRGALRPRPPDLPDPRPADRCCSLS